MKKITKNLLNFMSTRLGFVLILLVLYWIKTMWAYTIDFNLDIQGAYQVFLAIINPFPISLLLLGLALYVKRTKLFYSLASEFICSSLLGWCLTPFTTASSVTLSQ